MKTQHTPGPWSIAPNQSNHGESIFIQATDGKVISEVYVHFESEQNEATANAALIAAAPETAAERDRLKEINAGLIQALEFIALQGIDDDTTDDDVRAMFDQMKQAAEIALSKQS